MSKLALQRRGPVPRIHILLWLGGLDSNQDSQIQSLMAYR